MSTSPTPEPSPTTEQKVDTAVAIGGQMAEGLAPAVAPVIAAGVELEPEVYHLISLLIGFFHKKKVVAK